MRTNIIYFENTDRPVLCFAVTSPTKSLYATAYDAFANFCKRECPKIPAYFDRNWESCREMWANHA
ncbi:hypothetical protein PHYSODRAFT_286071, partial [Phytophthora sojae]